MKMRRVKYLVYWFLIVTIVFQSSCKKDEIPAFSGSAGINFVTSSFEYSFMTNPDKEYVQEIDVKVIGNAADHDRYFNAEVVRDSTTTAPDSLYQIIGGIVKAGEFTGKLSVKVLNTSALARSKVYVKLKIKDSEDFKAGVVETSSFLLGWTNQIVMPNPWSYFAYFFTSRGSTNAYRIILLTTGLTKFTLAEYRVTGNDGAVALGTKFGDYVMQWNKDHPNDRLKHDDGTLAGQYIVPLYYTHSKFD